MQQLQGRRTAEAQESKFPVSGDVVVGNIPRQGERKPSKLRVCSTDTGVYPVSDNPQALLQDPLDQQGPRTTTRGGNSAVHHARGSVGAVPYDRLSPDMEGVFGVQPFPQGFPSVNPLYMHAMANYPYYNPSAHLNPGAVGHVPPGPPFPAYMIGGYPGYTPFPAMMGGMYGSGIEPGLARGPYGMGGAFPVMGMPPVPLEYAAMYYQKVAEMQSAAQHFNSPTPNSSGEGPLSRGAPSPSHSNHEGASFPWGSKRASPHSGEKKGDRTDRSGSKKVEGRLRVPRKEAGTPGEKKVPTDAALDAFKNNKGKVLELRDIRGNVLELSTDQHGSRFVQQKLETMTSAEREEAFEEIFPHALNLMTDVFGNYVIQKFLDYGTDAHRSRLAGILQGHVLSLSLQMYGCRVIQKALEVMNTEQRVSLVKELDGHIMRCVRDQNGNHVIQKCIECVPAQRIPEVLDTFIGAVVGMSTHPFGCRVIQRVLEHCQDETKKEQVLSEILQGTCHLAQDQYGNYVVQHVLQYGSPASRSEVIRRLSSQIVIMSQHKFASNVVEKCLVCCGPEDRDVLIQQILGKDENDSDGLQQMMKDQFANYVVQRLLEVCTDEQRELLFTRIRSHLHSLKKFTYGKHIVARMEKLLSTGAKPSHREKTDEEHSGLAGR